MFELTIKKFRCWNSIKVSIPPSGITLIRGTSGQGKTTILQAIYWVLYGTLRQVAPIGDEKAKTNVVLTFPFKGSTFSIDRRKNPNRLLVEFDGKVYEDKVAQSLIENYFGAHDIWTSSSYLQQGSRNYFFTASNNEKMDLLNKIAFNEDDPNYFIEKIDSKINTIEAEVKLQSSILKREIDNFQLVVNKFTNYLEPDKLQELEKEKSALEEQIYKLQQEKRQREINLRLIAQVDQQLKSYQMAPVNPSDFGLDYPDLDLVERDLRQLIPKLNYRRQLISELAKLPDLSSKIGDRDWVSLNNSYQNNLRLAQSLNLPFDQVKLEASKEMIKQQISAQSYLRKRTELLTERDNLNRLKQKLKKPNSPTFNTMEEPVDRSSELNAEIAHQTSHLQQLTRRKNIIRCPHCENSLRYNFGSLIKADALPVNEDEIKQTQLTISSLNQKLQENRQALQNYHRYTLVKQQEEARYQQELALYQKQEEAVNSLEEKVRNLSLDFQERPEWNNLPLVTKTQEEKLQQVLVQIDMITVYPKPEISLDDLQRQQIRDLKVKQLAELQEVEISGNPQEILTRIENYKRQHQRYLSQLEIRNKLVLDKEQLESKLTLDRSGEEEILIRTLNELKIKKEAHLEAVKISEWHQKLTIDNQNLAVIQNKLNHLHVLRKVAVDTSCQIIDQIVNSLNSTLNDICNSIFERQMLINISLYKELKTTKAIRQNVNFNITYGGHEYSQLNQLSGGEGDRVSLALTLAFNRLSGYPILLIDEALASLDLNYKEMVIETLRENTDSAILLIQHDGVEGIFDHVINVDKIIDS